MNEATVQRVLTNWFEERGFEALDSSGGDSESKVDLVVKKGKEKWIVEVKGDYDRQTAQYSVNFDTGMGQILKSLTSLGNETKYAICVPFTRTERGERLSYRLILGKYSRSIAFEVLGIHIILVRDDESVEVIPPKDVMRFLSTIDPRMRTR